jgi:hypothetical protein
MSFAMNPSLSSTQQSKCIVRNACALLVASATLLGCGGGGNDGAPGTNGTNGAPGAAGANGTNGANGLNTLVAVSVEPADTHCATGGSRVDAGLDANGDGTLEASEITSTQYVCNGTAGASGAAGSSGMTTLVQVVDEPPGAHCSTGGKAINAGIDSNGNGVLDPSEISTTSYVCNGATGASLQWFTITDASTVTQAQSNTGYVASSDSQVVVNLPANPAIGDVVRVNGAGLGGWKITENAGQAVYTKNLGDMPGVTWTARDAVRNAWQAVASSANGARLVAVEYGGQIHTSSDGGVSWVAHESNRNWASVASSADGMKLVAADQLGQVYTSSDGGANWTAHSTDPSNANTTRNWISVASSADGNHLAALEENGLIYTSSDAGSTWTAHASSRNWVGVASSADGSKLVAIVGGGQTYTSSDSGTNWAAGTFPSAGSWSSVASSADGSKLVAATDAGQVYISNDSGVTWVSPTLNAPADSTVVVSSADGTKLVAMAGGQVFTSVDGGTTWTLRGTDTNRVWFAVAATADGDRLLGVEAATNGPGSGIYTSVATTTPGTGSISGTSSDTVELQYVGGGMFSVLSNAGSLTIQ